MSKTNSLKSKLFSIFAILFLLIGFLFNCPLQVNAASLIPAYGSIARVTADKLNVRNKDCVKIRTIGKNSILFVTGEVTDIADNSFYPKLIECKIDNQYYSLVQISLPNSDAFGLYVATDFIETAGLNPFVKEDKLELTLFDANVTGRNQNCERITTFKSENKIQTNKVQTRIFNDRSRAVIYCKINSLTYMLVPVATVPPSSVPVYIASDFIV